MNFIRVFQLSTLIILEICPTTLKAETAPKPVCEMEPTNKRKIDVTVYINGGTRVDDIWYQRYCSWLTAGFPYDKLTPITIKVGGNVICDENNNCNCPNEDNDTVDCTTTFQYVCIEQSLGQDKLKEFLCCLETFVDGSTSTVKDYQTCVNEQPGLAEKISKCMGNHADGPRDIALQNSHEVAKAGVDFDDNTEPFFFYDGIFKKCISDDSPGYWLQNLCLMLDTNVAQNLKQCKLAMGWK